MERIDVTKAFLPPIEEYQEYIQRIWKRTHLTNQGPLLQELEDKLKEYLRLGDLHFVANGTTALQLALRALNISGEVITTPFSYVATTSSILWEHCKPVFVDIEPKTFCIDANKIEAAITSKIKAIMPVHVFGYPCDTEKIASIAQKYKLKVIYDAAHAFGVKHKGKSLLDFGDVAICSFHATKLFHTIEGGCVIARDKAVSEKVELMKRFGHNGNDHYMLGMNAKASEFQAAMGLCNLKYIDRLIADRKAATELYDKLLGNRFQRPMPDVASHNFAYYPILFKNETQLLKVLAKLNAKNIFPRRYFYPSLNKLSYLVGNDCPISEDISSRIACLPLYAGLKNDSIKEIVRTIHAV